MKRRIRREGRQRILHRMRYRGPRLWSPSTVVLRRQRLLRRTVHIKWSATRTRTHTRPMINPGATYRRQILVLLASFRLSRQVGKDAVVRCSDRSTSSGAGRSETRQYGLPSRNSRGLSRLVLRVTSRFRRRCSSHLAVIRRRPTIRVGPHQALPVIRFIVIIRPILITKGIGQLLVIIVAEWVTM